MDENVLTVDLVPGNLENLAFNVQGSLVLMDFIVLKLSLIQELLDITVNGT